MRINGKHLSKRATARYRFEYRVREGDRIPGCVHYNRSIPGKPSRRVFAHTGWRVIDGKRVFLTSSGAIGIPEIGTQLMPPHDRYKLPTDPYEVDAKEAMQTSIGVLDIGKAEVQSTLWEAMYLTPLCEIINPDFTIWVVGESGAYLSPKSRTKRLD